MAQRARLRILQEAKEMFKSPSTLYTAHPLEEDIFEWHFTIRGPKGTEFEGGIYHGKILLPSEYPNSPPDFIFCTKNGRFEIEKKVCLTISSHHKESWQPSWGIRTALLAIIAFMPTRGDGAIASLDWPPEIRKKLAKESLAYACQKCGSHNLTALPPETDEEIDMSMISGISIKNKEQQQKDEEEKKRKELGNKTTQDPTEEVKGNQPDDSHNSENESIPQPIPGQGDQLPIQTELPKERQNPGSTNQTETLYNARAPHLLNQLEPKPTSSFYSSYSSSQRIEVLQNLDKFIVFVFCLVGLMVFRKFV